MAKEMPSRIIENRTTESGGFSKHIRICDWSILGCLICLVFVVPIVFNPYANEPFMPYKELMFQLLVGLFLCATALRLALGGVDKSFRHNCMIWFLLAYFLVNLASFGWAINTFEARKEITRQFYFQGMAIGLCLLVMRGVINKAFLRIIFFFALCGAFIISVMTILEYHRVFYLYASPGRLLGYFGYQNLIAQYLMAVIPLGLASVLGFGRWKWRVPAICMLLFVCYALLITFCRGAWMGTYFGLMVFCFLLMIERRRWQKITVIAVGLAIAVGAVGYVYWRAQSVSTEQKQKELKQLWSEGVPRELGTRFSWRAFFLRGDAERFHTWKNATDIIRKSPVIGVGAGNWKNHFMGHRPRLRSNIGYVHNDYLQILVDLGLIGIVVFAGIIFFAGSYYFEAIRAIPPPAQGEGVLPSSGGAIAKSIYAKAMVAVVVGTMVHMIFSFNYYAVTSAMFFWMGLGLLGGLGYRVLVESTSAAGDKAASDAVSQAPARSKIAIATGLVVSAVIFTGTLWITISEFRTRAMLDEAGRLHAAKKDAEAARLMDKALKIKPDPQLMTRLGILKMSLLSDDVAPKSAALNEVLNLFFNASELLPYDAAAHYWLGMAHFRNGEPVKAEASWLRTLKYFPMHIPSREIIIMMYEKQNRLAEAVPHYIEAINVAEEYSDAHKYIPIYRFRLALLFMNLSDFARAAQYFTSCLYHPGARAGLVEALEAMGNYAQALQQYDYGTLHNDPFLQKTYPRARVRALLEKVIKHEKDPVKLKKYQQRLDAMNQ